MLWTLGLLLLLGVIPPTARDLIPLGGMMMRNSMNATSLTMVRVHDDVREQRNKVEAALCPRVKTSLKSALIPLVDTKTGRIVFLLGAMAGRNIGGAYPLEAVRLQMIVLYMLLGSVSIAAISVGLLSCRSFFNERHQLRDWLYKD